MSLDEATLNAIGLQLIESHHIAAKQGLKFISTPGGDINQSYRVISSQQSYFLKISSNVKRNFFSSEFDGLSLLASIERIRCPKPIALGELKDRQYLLLECIPINASGNQYKLGNAIAELHQQSTTRADYGLDYKNYIGSTPQKNTHHGDWLGFWLNCRLEPQLKLAYQNGFRDALINKEKPLYQSIERLLQNHNPPPCLLHGDLWHGNSGFDTEGRPVIFDPACYYGDRETDIAMTELFGGFNSDFYRGYNETYPLNKHYSKRKTLYNLYHSFNHLNLFGAHYLNGCLNKINRLVAYSPSE